ALGRALLGARGVVRLRVRDRRHGGRSRRVAAQARRPDQGRGHPAARHGRDPGPHRLGADRDPGPVLPSARLHLPLRGLPMIERYTRPEMGAVWTEQARYRAWLRVELAVCEVLAERGVIPPEALATIRARAGFDVA